MPTIEEILGNIGVDEGAEKTASKHANHVESESEIEKQARELGLLDGETTKVASDNTDGGQTMNMLDIYQDIYGEDVEKTASANYYGEESFEKEAAALEYLGEMAGHSFMEGLSRRIDHFAVKLAMDGSPDSQAMQSHNGKGLMGDNTSEVQLPVEQRHTHMDGTTNDSPYAGAPGKAMSEEHLKKQLKADLKEELQYHAADHESGMERPKNQADA